MASQVAIVDRLVQDAVSKGARLLFGGKTFNGVERFGVNESSKDQGLVRERCVYFEPTVLADVTHDMLIAKEETFGPCVVIIKFNTEVRMYVCVCTCVRVCVSRCVVRVCDEFLPSSSRLALIPVLCGAHRTTWFAWPTIRSTASEAASSPQTMPKLIESTGELSLAWRALTVGSLLLLSSLFALCKCLVLVRIARALTASPASADFGTQGVVMSMPFGGVKDSGFGHFNGPEGLRSFTRIKGTISDRFPFRTYAPFFLQYPMHGQAAEIVGKGLDMVYAASWLQSLVAATGMLVGIVKAKLGKTR
jgi:hypothetical protein